VSQSKSDDNWIQEALDNSINDEIKITFEEVREIKKLRRRGFNEIADAYYNYLQLGKKEGTLTFTLKEFCQNKGIKYPLIK